MSQGLAQACQNLEKSMKQRTTDVNTDKVAAFIEKKIMANNNLLQTYEGMKLIAQKFESAPRGHYQLDEYQVYIAALLASATGSS